MNHEQITKCPVCGRAYKVFTMYSGNQSTCPACREAADNAGKHVDTAANIMRRYQFWK